MADILKLPETPLIDESVEEYQYHEYDPLTGTNLKMLLMSELVLNRKTCSHILARAT